MPSAFDEDAEARKVAAENLRSMARDDTNSMADIVKSSKPSVSPMSQSQANLMSQVMKRAALASSIRQDTAQPLIDSAVSGVGMLPGVSKATDADIAKANASLPPPIALVDQEGRRDDATVNVDRRPPVLTQAEYEAQFRK